MIDTVVNLCSDLTPKTGSVPGCRSEVAGNKGLGVSTSVLPEAGDFPVFS